MPKTARVTSIEHAKCVKTKLSRISSIRMASFLSLASYQPTNHVGTASLSMQDSLSNARKSSCECLLFVFDIAQNSICLSDVPCIKRATAKLEQLALEWLEYVSKTQSRTVLLPVCIDR